MGQEFERKFLVTSDAWRAGADAGTPYRQGYLATDGGMSVRVRREGSVAKLNVKAIQDGDLTRRHEYEYAIPTADADAMLDQLCRGVVIEKRRYRVPFDGFVWEVDVFAGVNAGLVVAEIELPAPDTPFSAPPWAGDDVSHDPRYLNSSLSKHPFTAWSDPS